MVSSLTQEGLDDAWNVMNNFKSTMVDSNIFIARRNEQRKKWMWNYVQFRLNEVHEWMKHCMNISLMNCPFRCSRNIPLLKKGAKTWKRLWHGKRQARGQRPMSLFRSFLTIGDDMLVFVA